MASRLPETISPKRLARNGARLEGHVTTEAMVRLRQACEGAVTDVAVCLEFGISDRRLPFVQGQVETVVQVQCQRCLEPMAVPLRVEVAATIGLPGDDGADSMAADQETLEIGDEAVSLVELVEDELLLALPDYPMHAESAGDGLGQCTVAQEYAAATAEPGQDTVIGDEDLAKRPSPFSALRALLNTETDKLS